MHSHKLLLNNLTFHINTWGNPKKPKLFLFHGWLDSGASFDFLVKHLQDRFYCIAPDLRGYGKSSHPKNPLGSFFFEYIADVHALLNALAPDEKVKVLAHSLGGAVLSIYAGIYPEKISHLINVEGFILRPYSFKDGPERSRRWLDEIGRPSFPVHKTLQDFAKRLRDSNPRLTPERALFLAKHLSRKVRGGYQMSADPTHKLIEPHITPPEFFEAFWNKIEAKTLLIAAKESPMFKRLAEGKSFRKAIAPLQKKFPKGTKVTLIAESGHMLHHEQPEALAKEVLNFLR